MDNLFQQIISLENLFAAWREFRSGKRGKSDVQTFERQLEDNLFNLHSELEKKTYRHRRYHSFYIRDPKQRNIHKATVHDRIIHHAIYRILYPLYNKTFIYDSYSCRLNKGAHRAVFRLEKFTRQTSQNFTKPCYALKCDVRKFFDSVDHKILLAILERKIKDYDILWLLQEIIGSFGKRQQAQLSLFDTRERERERVNRPSADNLKGIPIGNLTSQLFANIYMNEFDQFVKHKLKVKHYARYTDDFVIVSGSHQYLEDLIPEIESFLDMNLKLKLHPNKVTIRKVDQGVDFLGYVVFPHHRLLRTKTKRRIFKKLKRRVAEYRAGAISKDTLNQTLNSFLGVLSHANSYEISQELINQFWFWLKE